jgi:hypothetical protein
VSAAIPAAKSVDEAGRAGEIGVRRAASRSATALRKPSSMRSASSWRHFQRRRISSIVASSANSGAIANNASRALVASAAFPS